MKAICKTANIQPVIHTFTDAGRRCAMPASETTDFIPLSTNDSQKISREGQVTPDIYNVFIGEGPELREPEYFILGNKHACSLL